MAQKKTTDKDVKVKDLAPKKDAKGGAARTADGASADRGFNLNRGTNTDRGTSLDRGTGAN